MVKLRQDLDSAAQLLTLVTLVQLIFSLSGLITRLSYIVVLEHAFLVLLQQFYFLTDKMVQTIKSNRHSLFRTHNPFVSLSLFCSLVLFYEGQFFVLVFINLY